MIHLPPDLELYIEKHSTPLPAFLDELERTTFNETTYPQMLSGKIQAGFLRFLVSLLRPHRILEIGTFTGYATFAMASALPENASITTLENNPENLRIFRRFLPYCNKKSAIEIIEGDAINFLNGTNRRFDFIFLDADKENYPRYFQLLKPLLNPRGLWITDNTLWSGKVLSPQDPQAHGIARFNRLAAEDNQLEVQILPVRDGLMLITHKPA